MAQGTEKRRPRGGSTDVRAVQLPVRRRTHEENLTLQRSGQLDGGRRAERVRHQRVPGEPVHDHHEEIGSPGRGRHFVPRSFLASRSQKDR